MSASQQSDRLDNHLMVVSRQRYYGVPIALAIIVALSMTSWLMLFRLGQNNHKILKSQIPSLTSQIETRDTTISDQQAVISQAVAEIEKLAKQVKALGGDPGEIVLKPPSHKEG